MHNILRIRDVPAINFSILGDDRGKSLGECREEPIAISHTPSGVIATLITFIESNVYEEAGESEI